MVKEDDSPRIGSSGGNNNSNWGFFSPLQGTHVLNSNGESTTIIAPQVLKESALSKYTSLSNTALGQFNLSGYGLTPGQMNASGEVSGDTSLVYDNGNLLVRNDMINAFYSIFAAQNKTALAKSTQFLAQDTVLTGDSASKKGTVLGGVV